MFVAYPFGVTLWDVAAFFGIGGGSLTVPFLSACRVSMRNAVATSAACGLPIAVFGALMYAYQGAEIDGLPDFASGYIYWPAFVGIAIASTPFAKLGAKLASRLPERALKKAFAVLLGCIGARMFFV